MKKLSFLLMAVLAVSVIMSSCKKDEDAVGPPTLDFKGGANYVDEDQTIAVNTIFEVGIAATANAETNKKLTSLRLTRTANNTTFIDTTYTINETLFNADFQFNSQSAGVVETILFVLTDGNGQTASQSLNITYEQLGSAVTKNANVLMGSFNDDNGSFYSTSAKMVYSIADATANQSSIDFLFYLGVTNGSAIASPADEDANSVYAIEDWTTKNATLFSMTEMTVEEFDAIGDTHVFPEFTGDKSGITQLATANVIMFKTVENKLGYIKLNSINGRGDHIDLDVIISE